MCWHKWSKWKAYENEYKKLIKGTLYEDVDLRQQRECKKCGKIQDELVR